MKTRLIILLTAIMCFPGFVSGQTLTRHYSFQETTVENPVAKNLAAEDGGPAMTYRTEHPFTVVAGSTPGAKAVRLDAGYFEAEAFPVDAEKKAFTVTMRVRLLGPGTETGNAGYRNGTLFGMGDGYTHGTRYTVDANHWQSGFALGGPAPNYAVYAGVNQPWPVGAWMHLAACWDGEIMTVYWNGVPQSRKAYSGDFVPANWGFRVGFNNAGVGSVKMDVEEVRVYDGALAAGEILRQAYLGKEELPPEIAAALAQFAESMTQKNRTVASLKYEEHLAIQVLKDFRIMTFPLMLAEMQVQTGRTGEGMLRFASIAKDKMEMYPQAVRDYALLRCVPNDEKTPLVLGNAAFYTRMLETPEIAEVLTDAQKAAVQRCVKLAALYVGKGEKVDPAAAACAEELIKKRHVRDYLAEERAEVAAERARLAAGKSPWAPVEMKKPFPEKFIPVPRFYVAPDGKAENPGTQEAPLGTLTQARDAVRKLRAERKAEGKSELPSGGVMVLVKDGVYETYEPLELTAEDSGTADAPVVYYGSRKSAQTGNPIFTGCVKLTGFKPVTDAAILARLPEESRGKVMQVNVADCGVDVKTLPPVKPRGFGMNGPGASPWLDVYYDGQPLQIARYPNKPAGIIDEKSAFLRTGEILSEHKDGAETRVPGVFRFSDADERYKRWKNADALWFFGYWKHLWAANSAEVEKLDADAGEVTVITAGHTYGYVPDAPFYAFNLLEEIDLPGEWFLDRKSGVLYVWPPEGVETPEKMTLRMTVMQKPFIIAKDVSHTTFIGLTFQESCVSGTDIQGGERFWLAGCTFRRFGAWGVSIHGKQHGVLGCDIHQLGAGGVSISGGNVRTLTPGECFVENCHISQLTRVDHVYGPAVSMDGCGNRIAHNLMHDSPAHGMRMGGFEHTVEFNEIHSVVYESDDQSGIDMFGNPALRGNVIRYNYWHHIGSGRSVAGQSGIRLDDMISGVLMYGNVFYRASGGHFGGIQIHGGKDNISDNNLFLDCKYAFSYSPWGEDRWRKNLVEGGFAQAAKNSIGSFTSEPHASRYPDYAEITENANRNFVLRNTAVGCGAFARNERGQNVVLGNVMLPWQEIKFDALGRPVIPYDWGVYRMNGMRPLPTEKMGLYADPRLRPRVEKSTVTERYVVE